MKHLALFFLGALLLGGLSFTTSGCVADGYVSDSVYYGPRYRDPWFHDDPWMDGGRWNRNEPRGASVDIYISPPRPPSPPHIRRP